MSRMKNGEKTVALNITLTAIFAALCCAATMIAVPLPFGYFNLGDIIVVLSAWLLGPVFGALASGLGAALADLILGFATYAPATFVIKFLVAVVAFSLFGLLNKITFLRKTRVISCIVSAALAELVMVSGYFVFEAFIMGYGVGGALSSVVGNLMQAVVGAVGSTLLMAVLSASKTVKDLFKIN